MSKSRKRIAAAVGTLVVLGLLAYPKIESLKNRDDALTVPAVSLVPELGGPADTELSISRVSECLVNLS